MKCCGSILLSAGVLTMTAGALPAQTLAVLHTFSTNSADGRESLAPLALSDATLYGTTYIGGAHNNGTVFSVGTNGANFQLLKSFSSTSVNGVSLLGTNADGALPNTAGVVLAGNTLYGTTYGGGTNGEGVVFSMDVGGTNFLVLHVFGNGTNDGAQPRGGLVLSGDTLYGTTQTGGAANFGTVFQIKTNGGGFQLLHSFATVASDGNGNLTNADGANPYDSPLLSGGTLYGTTESAGPNGSGTVFSLNIASGAFQVLHAFDAVRNFANKDGANCQAPLALFGGRLYGGAYDAGLDRRGTLFSLGTNGSDFTVIHQFQGPPDGVWPFGGLTVFGTRLYGTANDGGPGTNSGEAFSIDVANNSKVSLVFGFDALRYNGVSASTNYDGSQPWATLIQSGNTFYGTTSGGGTNGDGTVFALTLPTVVDTTKPKLGVSSPTPGMNVTNAAFTASGTASDNVGVTGVFCQLNGGAWVPASSDNAWIDWTADLDLTPDLNILRAYAVDGAGNKSATNTVSFVYVLKKPLTVQITGNGGVNPTYKGKTLQVGQVYPITAIPDPGFGFLDWTGGVLTNSAKLKFEMEPGLTLIANFVDTKRPVAIITYPAVGHVFSNATISVAGKASDNVGVTDVWCQLDGTGWIGAESSNGFTNWTAPDLSLKPGTNIVQAFALDAAGNVSLTNSIRFYYRMPPDWAFQSLSNLTALAVPKSGKTTRTTFGAETFNQTGVNGDSEPADFGVGNYVYQKTGTNAAHLVKTFTAPPSTAGAVADILLTFTGADTASFTNQSDGEHGAITYSRAAAVAPSSLAGKTITAMKSTGGTVTIALNAGGTYVQREGGKQLSGNYTFNNYSPNGALLQLTATDLADSGVVTYIQQTFSTAESGSFFTLIYSNLGSLEETVAGSFVTN